MTTTPQGPSARHGQPPPQRPAPQLRVAPPPRERRPALAVAAVVLVLVSAAIAATLVVRAGDRSEVLAVARTVPVGQQLTVGDLKRVRISTDPGLHTIPVSAAPQVVGKVAATTLLPGTLLTPEQLGAGQLPGPGQAIVGLDLKGAQMPVPAERLQPGAKVRIVATPSPSGAPAAEGASLGSPSPGRVLVDQAEVFSVQAVASTDAVHVAVVVAQADLARVLRAAAAGQVSLAVLPAATAGP
jgi:SAF domain